MHCEELKSSCVGELALLIAYPSLAPPTGTWVSQVSLRVLLPHLTGGNWVPSR